MERGSRVVPLEPSSPDDRGRYLNLNTVHRPLLFFSLWIVVLMLVMTIGDEQWWALELLRANLPYLIVVLVLTSLAAVLPHMRPPFSKGASLPGLILLALLFVVVPILLWKFRMQLFLPPPAGLGDSLLLLEHVPVYSRLLGYLDTIDELLELYVRSRAYLWLNDSRGLPIEEVYAYISYAALIPYLLFVYVLWQKRSFPERLALLALTVAVPAVQLYAGYVENYTIASTFLFGTLAWGARLLEERPQAAPSVRPLLLLALLAGVGALFHLIVGLLLPALAYFAWVYCERRPGAFVRGAFAAGLCAVLLFGACALYFLTLAPHPPIPADSHFANPPVLNPSRWFSADHVIGHLNLFLLASPAAPAALLTLLLYGSPDRKRWSWIPDLPTRFLAIATLTLLAWSFVWNGIIGLPADWDLLTMFQGPLNLYLWFLFVHAGRQNPATPSTRLALAMLALNLLVTAAWITRNAEDSEASRANLKRAHENVELFLERTAADPVYEIVSAEHGLERQRIYIQVSLFIVRSRARLAQVPQNETTRAQLERLEIGRQKFERWILLPPAEFENERAEIWNELSALNREING
ncbi:MAG: hypothetical protein KDK35_04580 [Leptospiraceae bacterium]|nr:hypothetical protein [Leptospiraceae bacterium]